MELSVGAAELFSVSTAFLLTRQSKLREAQVLREMLEVFRQESALERKGSG